MHCLISQNCSLTYFLIKPSTLEETLILQSVCPGPALCLWQNHLAGSPFAQSSLFLRLKLGLSSWSQPPKPANVTRFLPLFLWKVLILSFSHQLFFALWRLSSSLENCSCYISSRNALYWPERTKELQPFLSLIYRLSRRSLKTGSCSALLTSLCK